MKYSLPIVLAWFTDQALPTPHLEYVFAPPRKWRFDFAWPEQKVALEVEGAVWTRGRHTRGSGFVKDMEKYNLAAIMGWRVLRCVPDDVCLVATTDMIAKALNL